jgi:hypothetical protein
VPTKWVRGIVDQDVDRSAVLDRGRHGPGGVPDIADIADDAQHLAAQARRDLRDRRVEIHHRHLAATYAKSTGHLVAQPRSAGYYRTDAGGDIHLLIPSVAGDKPAHRHHVPWTSGCPLVGSIMSSRRVVA